MRPRAVDYISPPEAALELPLDQFAVQLLRYFVVCQSDGGDRSFVHRGNLSHKHVWERDGGFTFAKGDDALAFLTAVQEAWDWLVTNGLLTRDPRMDSTEWGIVTRRGHEWLGSRVTSSSQPFTG